MAMSTHGSIASPRRGGRGRGLASFFLSHVFVGALCFYFGSLLGLSTSRGSRHPEQAGTDAQSLMKMVVDGREEMRQYREYCDRKLDGSRSDGGDGAYVVDVAKGVIPSEGGPADPEWREVAGDAEPLSDSEKDDGGEGHDIETEPSESGDGGGGNGGSGDPRFPPNLSAFAAGLARTPKNSFMERFDYGWPEDNNHSAEKSEVLLLYNKDWAIPDDDDRAAFDGHIPLLSPDRAVSNCDLLRVVAVGDGDSRSCTAIVGQYESAHVARFMRRGDEGWVDSEEPLVRVGRVDDFEVPNEGPILGNWKRLQTYFSSYETVRGELEPILRRTALKRKGESSKGAVVVMVCNMGQSTLLVNFVCAARSRGIDLSNVLVFATDQKTADVAQGLGLETYYDRLNFENLPEEEAKQYGDMIFTAMMHAKVVAVQLVNFMGYDVLFQDVDVVWYRHPLPVLRDPSGPLQQHDILFQDDGQRAQRYAPFCANSGFYYVRYNKRTRYLLTSVLYHGDDIVTNRSHQQTLASLLTEHASLYGLKVKTLSGFDYPCGFHYHRRKEFLRDVVSGKKSPWLFHMSWTANKDDKLLFLRQMGLWHVREECVDHGALMALKVQISFADRCCSVEPLVSCHYRDKPSVVPCKDSPPMEENKKSFW